jgi:hypothetical protein
VAFLECNHGGENLLPVFYNGRVGLEDALDGCGNFMGGEAISAVQHPYGFNHGNNLMKPGFGSVKRRPMISAAFGD